MAVIAKWLLTSSADRPTTVDYGSLAAVEAWTRIKSRNGAINMRVEETDRTQKFIYLEVCERKNAATKNLFSSHIKEKLITSFQHMDKCCNTAQWGEI